MQAADGVGDAEGEAPVGQGDDVLLSCVGMAPAAVGHHHDGELEPLGPVDGHQPDRVAALLLDGRGFGLAGARRGLGVGEGQEARQVWPAQGLVLARQAHELAHVGVAAAPVALGQAGQVVVVVGDDRSSRASSPSSAAAATSRS